MPVPAPSGAKMRDLPGFYYDEEKKRYFKIEAGRTAPSSAAWSEENVKKRKAEKQMAAREQKRLEKTMGLIKRSEALAHPQTGGRLAREFGVVDLELPVASWAAGLRERGSICFLPGQEWMEDAPDISCMIINGDDEASGMGAAYATPDGHHVIGSYIPTDKDDKINFRQTDQMMASRLASLRPEAVHQDEITSMAYHRASHHVVVTSTNLTGPGGSPQCQICIFQPLLYGDLMTAAGVGADADDDATRQYFREGFGGARPAWLLGCCDSQLRFTSPVRGLSVNSIRACPSSPPGETDVLLATSHGVIQIRGDGQSLDWVTPAPGDQVRWVSQGRGGRGGGGGSGGGGGGSSRGPAILRDVFSADYHPSNRHVIYAGCRDAGIRRIDVREAPLSGYRPWQRHHSAVAHVRCLDDHQVLAAGPRNAMAIYDARWGSSKQGGGSSNGIGNAATPRPVVEFPGYRNAAHVRVGLDVTRDAGGVAGLGCGGVVATGMDDGSVGVFSLRSGRRLRAGDVDDAGRLRASGGPGRPGVFKALQFERMPWETGTSLFVGVGPVVKKFSFGVDEDEEW